MKKIITLCVALCATIATYAQQQLATLNHNDTITVFSGIDALVNAHTAAVNGDVITLSSGYFNSTTITKAITIRGAGMAIDSVAGTTPTVLNGTLGIGVPNDTLHHLTIEGISIPNSFIVCTVAYRPQFIKCKIYWFSHNNSQSTIQNVSMVNCIVQNTSVSNVQYVNSVVFSVGSTVTGCTFNNCVAGVGNVASHTCTNSILFAAINYDGQPSYSSNYCVGITPYSFWGANNSHSCNYYDPSTLTNNNRNYSGNTAFSSVFKTFRGNFVDGENYELLDNSTLLGSDGTQVGIYGGVMPFNPYVRHPRIGRCNVANRSTADGKLSVDIEVISE